MAQLADTQRMIGSILGNAEASAEHKYSYSNKKSHKVVETPQVASPQYHQNKHTVTPIIRTTSTIETPKRNVSPLKSNITPGKAGIGISIGGKDVSEFIQTSQRKGIPVASVNLSLDAKKLYRDLSPSRRGE